MKNGLLAALTVAVVYLGYREYTRSKKKCPCQDKAPVVPAEPLAADVKPVAAAQTAASTGVTMNADGFNKAFI